MSFPDLKADALAWCGEGRNALVRIPLLLYGVFLLWKIAIHPEFFTPIDWLDLAIHEMGHVVFAPFGQWICVAGGSIAQVIAPFFGIWQFLRQRDYFGAVFSLGWLGESMSNVSRYIDDARSQELMLTSIFGGDPLHDWNFLLGSMNRLAQDHTYARWVRLFGFLFAALFCWLGSWLVWKMWLRNKLFANSL